MQRINFEAGEQRHIKLRIHATDNAPFTIRTAQWELCHGGEIESAGTCGITEHTIDAFICPEKRVTYRLRIIYQIADETLVELVEVAVT